MNREWAAARVAEYLTLADKWLHGQRDLAALDELNRRAPLMQRISEALGISYGEQLDHR
jgi:hypothetical protein